MHTNIKVIRSAIARNLAQAKLCKDNNNVFMGSRCKQRYLDNAKQLQAQISNNK